MLWDCQLDHTWKAIRSWLHQTFVRILSNSKVNASSVQVGLNIPIRNENLCSEFQHFEFRTFFKRFRRQLKRIYLI